MRGIIATLAILASVLILRHGLDQAGHLRQEILAGRQLVQELDCVKIDDGTGSDALTVDKDYRLVVLKSGTVNDEFYGVKAGDTIRTESGKDISHYILCGGEDPSPTTTTTQTSTSTP